MCGQDTRSSSTATHQHLQKPVFGCGCKHCTITNFMDGCRSPVTTKTGLPYLDASGLTEGQKNILVGRLLDESQDMLFAFSAPFIEGNKVTETTKHPTWSRIWWWNYCLLMHLIRYSAKPMCPLQSSKNARGSYRMRRASMLFSSPLRAISHSSITRSSSTLLQCSAQTSDDQEEVQKYKETVES